jgi:hypothetical protein
MLYQLSYLATRWAARNCSGYSERSASVGSLRDAAIDGAPAISARDTPMRMSRTTTPHRAVMNVFAAVTNASSAVDQRFFFVRGPV